MRVGRIAKLLRLASGPLTLAAFFLPWASGAGPLAATDFSGLRLVRFSESLAGLDLGAGASAAVWAVHIGLITVAIAATWQTLLAPARPRARLCVYSGWYSAGAALVAGTAALAFGLDTHVGLHLWAVGAGCFVISELGRPALRSRRIGARDGVPRVAGAFR